MCVRLRETTTDEIVARTWERSQLLVMLDRASSGHSVVLSHNIYVYAFYRAIYSMTSEYVEPLYTIYGKANIEVVEPVGTSRAR